MEFLKRLFGTAPTGPTASPAELPSRSAQAWIEWARSGSGFERQEAVEMLGHLRHAPALPMLLIRVNDWVPQVRVAAIQAVRALIDEAFVDEWVRAIESIVALDRGRRADHAVLLGEVAEFLARPACLSRVRVAVPRLSPGAKRYVGSIEWHAADSEEGRVRWLSTALASDDIVLARTALARLPLLDRAAQCTLARVARRSRFSVIREAGLRRSLEEPTDARDLVHAYCQDSSAMVRAIAWGAAKRLGEAEAVMISARWLVSHDSASARQRAIALQLLCMADVDGALNFCARFATASSAALRRVAIQTLLSRSKGGEHEAWLLTALADPSAQVQKLAVDAVQRGALPPDAARVIEVALAHRDARALTRAFAVLRHYSLWLRLHWLLTTLGEALPAESTRACLAALSIWDRDATSSFVTPSEAEKDRLREDWRRHSNVVPEALRKSITWHLQTNYKILKEMGDDD